eukprot:112774-Prymnesium_polylepis.1
MHNQLASGLSRSGREAFPWAGGWIDLPQSAASGCDDPTPPSVCAGRRAEAVAALPCVALQCSAHYTPPCPLLCVRWLPWPGCAIPVRIRPAADPSPGGVP